MPGELQPFFARGTRSQSTTAWQLLDHARVTRQPNLYRIHWLALGVAFDDWFCPASVYGRQIDGWEMAPQAPWGGAKIARASLPLRMEFSKKSPPGFSSEGTFDYQTNSEGDYRADPNRPNHDPGQKIWLTVAHRTILRLNLSDPQIYAARAW